MWPTLVDLGNGAGVHTYGLFILAAFCSAFMLVHALALRGGLHPDRLLGVYLAAAVGGLSGGRLLYAVAVEPQRTLADPLSLLSFSGFAVYGGILGGILAVGLVARAQGIHIWKLADIAAPAVLLGMGVGRVGCFFAGCCHGDVVDHIGDAAIGLFPYAFTGGQVWLSAIAPFLTLEFHGGVGRLHDVPLYPTQVWAAAYLTLLAGLLTYLWTKRRFDGQIAALTLIIEPWFRSAVEAYRADHRGVVVSVEVSDAVAAWLPGMSKAGASFGEASVIGLTTSQALGLVAVAIGVGIYAVRRNAGVDEEIPIEVDPLDDPAVLDEL
ncbi:MAG: phosphatidylglycerol:prolipoprotein diacylglycerol transferase [Myxococcota bacterium]|jgi:phosphatidylglycerol:prolipoprotein diacylglycerol transferase